jgi:hypothetical protein
MFSLEAISQKQEARSQKQEARGKNQEPSGVYQNRFVNCGKMLSFFFILFSLFFSVNANAQCAMCRASLESEGNVAKAEGINDGIVYLMVIPYVLIACVGYYVYKTRRSKKVK